MPSRTTRVIPTASIKAQSATPANGRSYSIATGMQDVPDMDAQVLSANGWAVLGMVGTTANRPKATDDDMAMAFGVGMRYIDTTLAAMIVWDGANWRNVATGAAV